MGDTLPDTLIGCSAAVAAAAGGGSSSTEGSDALPAPLYQPLIRLSGATAGLRVLVFSVTAAATGASLRGESDLELDMRSCVSDVAPSMTAAASDEGVAAPARFTLSLVEAVALARTFSIGQPRSWEILSAN